jgi:hypothetical protein
MTCTWRGRIYSCCFVRVTDKMDAIHALLQLQPGEPLLNQVHPVYREWDPELG